MATRHQVRTAAISLLYAHEMGTFTDDFASEFLNEQKIKNEQRAYAMELVSGVLSRQNELDDEINARLASFKLSELGAMERAILRLGAYEIIAKKCDARVAISEAVILASEFGSDSAPKLVNGVLNNIFKGEGILEQPENSKLENWADLKNSQPENWADLKNSKNSKSEFYENLKNSAKNTAVSKNSKTEFYKKAKNSSTLKNSKPKFNKENSKNSAPLKNSKFSKKSANTAKKDAK